MTTAQAVAQAHLPLFRVFPALAKSSIFECSVFRSPQCSVFRSQFPFHFRLLVQAKTTFTWVKFAICTTPKKEGVGNANPDPIHHPPSVKASHRFTREATSSNQSFCQKSIRPHRQNPLQKNTLWRQLFKLMTCKMVLKVL